MHHSPFLPSHMLGLVNSQVGIRGQKLKGLTRSVRGVWYTSLRYVTTQILTGKVACSTGVPYGEKHKPGTFSGWQKSKTLVLLMGGMRS